MPNISNYLLVRGNKVDAERFFASARGYNSAFDFESLVPIPSKLLSVDPYGSEGQRKIQEWAVENWGVKYNCFDAAIAPPLAQFKTAWNLPFAFLNAVSLKFPSLIFTNEWIEEKYNSAGIVKFLKGQIFYNKAEHFSQWQECKTHETGFIHQLSVEHELEQYLAYLRAGIENATNDVEIRAYRFHLNLIEIDETTFAPD